MASPSPPPLEREDDKASKRPLLPPPSFALSHAALLTAEMQVKKVPQFKSFAAPASNPTPKFGSFKPAASAVKVEESGRRDEERKKRDRSAERRQRHDDRDRHRRHRSRDRGRDRDKDKDGRGHSHRDRKDRDRERSSDRHRKRRHSRSRSRSPKRGKDDKLTLQSTQDPTILPWETPDLPYQIDTRGDPHNLTYGTIHRYNIPKYWRYGRDRILGLDKSYRIESDKGDGKGVVVGKVGGRGDGRVRGWAYAVDESRMLKVKSQGDEEEGFVEGWDFVAFPGSRKRKRDGGDGAENKGEGSVDYRSIEGLQKGAGKEVESDVEEIDSSDDDVAAMDAEVKERTIYLSRLVDSEPQNIDAWFSLMNHQEVIIYGNGEHKRRKVRQGERQGLEEVKLGILDKAISKNPGTARLLLEYMKIATGIWEPQKVKAKWEDILSKNSTIIEVWQGYINFRQADFVSFKYQECLKVYEECIGKLKGRILRFGVEDEEKAKLEEILLYILTRATTFMDQAGFSELSVAIWQGILEMNSSPPRAFASGPDSLTNHEEMLDSIGAFWDSEVLRIGEAKAKGWAAYADEDIGDFADPKDLPDGYSTSDDLLLNDPDFFGAWLDKEKTLLGKLPARTTDEIEEDDPFRVILFSDIRQFLWKFQTPIARSSIGDAFIAFIGVVAPTQHQRDSYFRADLARVNERALSKWFWHDNEPDVKLIAWVNGVPMEPERRSRVSRNPFSFHSSSLPLSPESLFPSNWWFSSVEVPDLSSERLDYGIAMLREFISRVPDERLALIYFAIECRKNPGNNKKVAKQLLKKYSHSLQLWNAYAMSEVAQGSKDAAKVVYQTALKMSASFSEEQQRFAIELWRSWIWSEMDEGNEEAALALLLRIPEGHAAIMKTAERSATAILKAQRFLEEQQDRMQSQRDLDIARIYAELRSLLRFLLTKERVPTTFLQPLDDLIQDVDGNENSVNESILEQLYMSKSRLFYHYATTARPYKAAAFREFLEPVIKRYPDNTAFLSLFVWNESRSKIEYRIRTMLMPDVSPNETEQSVVKWVFSIWAEMQMGAGRGVNPNAVRNLFEKAVGSERLVIFPSPPLTCIIVSTVRPPPFLSPASRNMNLCVIKNVAFVFQNSWQVYACWRTNGQSVNYRLRELKCLIRKQMGLRVEGKKTGQKNGR
ncbi:hypothetical protein ABW19_dt0205711 [Dactylella cylindrospora]|nr:hypothetical protein ABW19_dt0205711 [Dactylella cylindrospora]